METQDKIKELEQAPPASQEQQNRYVLAKQDDLEGQELGLRRIRNKVVHYVAVVFFIGLSIMAAVTIMVIFWHTLTPSHWQWLNEGHVLIETRSSMVGASIGSLVSMLVSRFFRST